MLFTFPSRYWFTIGLSGVFSLAGWAPLFHTEFLVFRTTQDTTKVRKEVVYGVITLFDRTFQSVPLSLMLPTSWSYNPADAETSAVWAVPRSLATTGGITFVFFSYGYLDVSVPHVRSMLAMVTGLQPDGLPHSEIKGSFVICTSPLLIAAYHVLLRLREPRHPPSALAYFLFPFRVDELKKFSFSNGLIYFLAYFFALCLVLFYCFCPSCQRSFGFLTSSVFGNLSGE